MRAMILALSFIPAIAATSPVGAQISGGVGSSNAANQAFQQQNTIRGIQQQQTFNNNQLSAQQRTNQMYNQSGAGSQGFVPRRRRR